MSKEEILYSGRLRGDDAFMPSLTCGEIRKLIIEYSSIPPNEIPKWVIDYDKANHQSSAGKAIRILFTNLQSKDKELEEAEDRIKDLEDGLKTLRHGLFKDANAVNEYIDKLLNSDMQTPDEDNYYGRNFLEP